ncbi:protease inhibitor I42 family protein [Lutibacter sp. TH_r2]|uniref:protease inhibitor I42 family protein n=1 Tax=Lutibacter sp. TH_r2 TaxID=3082083 RepID=UPI00295428D9|nr:protease inhibitor I42 family protein [Lutibacter sp. TH_r2]MDV7185692.1 protease inhibitor I42 family protein [Lutibacter sp. TH_r2]
MKSSFFALILLLTFFSSCEKDDTTENENVNTDYAISIDEEFNVELIANHTTGYSWEWTNSNKIDIVENTDKSYIIDNPELSGSGGKEIWIFKGVKKGLDTIKMEYNQSWTPDSTIDSKTIVVEVK